MAGDGIGDTMIVFMVILGGFGVGASFHGNELSQAGHEKLSLIYICPKSFPKAFLTLRLKPKQLAGTV